MPSENERKIGELISKELEIKGLNPEYVGRIIYGFLEFKNPDSDCRDEIPETGVLYVQLVLNGFMYGSNGNAAKILEKRRSLSRLAILLHAIGVEPDAPLIKMVLEHDGDFVYPPGKGICLSALKIVHEDLRILEEEINPNQDLVERVQGYLTHLRSTSKKGEIPVKFLGNLLERVPELKGYRPS